MVDNNAKPLITKEKRLSANHQAGGTFMDPRLRYCTSGDGKWAFRISIFRLIGDTKLRERRVSTKS